MEYKVAAKVGTAPDGAAGPWYVVRTDNGIVDSYLHSDGSWRESTRSKHGWTGYYATKTDAQGQLLKADVA